MKMPELQAIIKKTVREVFRNEINDLLNERLEEFENEIADAINEAVDIKLQKKIKQVLSKKSLAEKIQERNGGVSEDLNNDWEYLSQPDTTRTSPLREKLSTGIVDDFIKETRGSKPQANRPLSTLPAPKLLDITKVSGNPDDYANTDEMINELANVDYGELLD